MVGRQGRDQRHEFRRGGSEGPIAATDGDAQFSRTTLNGADRPRPTAGCLHDATPGLARAWWIRATRWRAHEQGSIALPRPEAELAVCAALRITRVQASPGVCRRSPQPAAVPPRSAAPRTPTPQAWSRG
jgi:hypothetical protein